MNNPNTVECSCGMIGEETKCFIHNIACMNCKCLENDLRYITDYIRFKLQLFDNSESLKKMENAYVILHTAHTQNMVSNRITNGIKM